MLYKFIIKCYIFCLIIGIQTPLIGQVVLTNPYFASENESLIVTFYADKGDKGLMGFTGDVYAHTGVITEKSSSDSDWKYVKSGWGVNVPATKLTRILPDRYILPIGPSVREYYGVPAGGKILKMAFVFRSADNALTGRDNEGKDIFASLHEPGVSISIVSPGESFFIAEADQTIDIELRASQNDSILLFLNDIRLAGEMAQVLQYSLLPQEPGNYTIRAVAKTETETRSDSVLFLVNAPTQILPLPSGIREGINYHTDGSLTLALYAPFKKHVYVLGDFNDWKAGPEWQMARDNSYYWITISNINPGEEYAYQYLVDGTLRIADPYTDKVLDPWHDQWISSSTYPNLKPYPVGKTSGIVSVFQTQQEEYEWSDLDFIPPDKSNLVIYELLVRDFVAAHDWKTLTDTLNYFSNLGVNAIELMPFNEFEGNESWGYNTSFYFAPDKYYGPKNTLKAFIDSCHNRGIAVIMDMVLNHSYGQSPLVQLYWNPSQNRPSSSNPWYNQVSPNPVYSWGYDFNHESPDTKRFVDRVNQYWIEEYKIDGYRFDFTKGFTNRATEGTAYDASRIAILKRMADALWSVKPDAYVILEHFADNSEEKELAEYGMMIWGNINCAYSQASMGFSSGPCSWNLSHASYKQRGWNKPHLVAYMESHDEERLMFKNLEYGNSSGLYNIKEAQTALRRIELAAALFFPIPGPKMIWQFGELGYDFSIDYNGRVGNKPIKWEYYDERKRLYQVFSSLIKLKTTEAAFNTSDYAIDLSGAVKRIELNHSDMNVRIVGNFDVAERAAVPNFSHTGLWYEYFSGTTFNVTKLDEQISLKAGEYRIFTSKRLPVPDISLYNGEVVVPGKNVTAYPNPFIDFLHIKAGKIIRSLNIYNSMGSRTRMSNVNDNYASINLSAYSEGLYFVEIHFEDGDTEYIKVIKGMGY
jgi:1,4-alpha-glucan branching enzyme